MRRTRDSALPIHLHPTVRIAAALGGLVLVPACSQSPIGDQNELAAPPVQWRELPESSFGWDEQSDSGGRAVRCWKRGDSFDCLAVSSVGGWSIMAHRYSVSRHTDDAPVIRGGYGCIREHDVINERIFRGEADGPSLVTNTVALRAGQSPWSREYVERYLADNSIPADQRYLNCLGITQLLREGSAATINTTSLTYGNMTGHSDPDTQAMEAEPPSNMLR